MGLLLRLTANLQIYQRMASFYTRQQGLLRFVSKTENGVRRLGMKVLIFLCIMIQSNFARSETRFQFRQNARIKLNLKPEQAFWSFTSGQALSSGLAQAKVSTLSDAISKLIFPKDLNGENLRLQLTRDLRSSRYRDPRTGHYVFLISIFSDSQYDARLFSENPDSEPILTTYKAEIVEKQKKVFGSERGGGRFGRYVRWLWLARDAVCQTPGQFNQEDFAKKLALTSPLMELGTWRLEEKLETRKTSLDFNLRSDSRLPAQSFVIELKSWLQNGAAYFHRVSVRDGLDMKNNRSLATWEISQDCIVLGGRLTGVDQSDRSAFRMVTVDPRGAIVDTAYTNRRVLSWEKIYGTGAAQKLELEWKTSPQEIRVGLLDTGVDYNHKLLARYMPREGGQLVLGWDAADGDRLPYDFDYNQDTVASGVYHHGSAVAGRVVAGWNEKTRSLRLVPLRISRTDDHSLFDLVKYAAQNSVNVINVSQGGVDRARWQWLDKAMIEFPDVLFVSAAGNEALDLNTHVDYPSHFQHDNHVVVAAVDTGGRPAYDFTNFGNLFVDLAANGVELKLLKPENSEFQSSGTSFAAPYVAGLAASLRARYPAESPADIKARLVALCKPTPQLKNFVRCGGYIP